MTDLTKPEPPAERLRNRVAPLVAHLQHYKGAELLTFQARDVQWMLDGIMGVVAELEAAGLAWFCAGCGRRTDGPHVCRPCAERLPEVSEDADRYCYGCGALYAGDGYAHQPECRVAERTGEAIRQPS